MELVAHRGFARCAPENTIAAVRSAGAAGADAVEVDVRTASDGTPVVVHDATVSRVTDRDGSVGDYSPPELAGMDVLDSGEGIPTLAAVLDAAADADLAVNVELKEQAVAPATVDAIRESSLSAGAVWVSSFDCDALREFATADEDIAGEKADESNVGMGVDGDSADRGADGGNAGLGVGGGSAIRETEQELAPIDLAYLSRSRREDPIAVAEELGCRALHLQYRQLFVSDVVARAHDAGMDVYAWTLASPFVARVVAHTGVDGLIADVPLLD